MVNNKADNYMYESIINIQEHGHKDVNPRPKWHDGTPAHTLSVNGVMHSYNIAEGEFPLTNLRRVVFKKAIGEILWIYRDASNDLNDLSEKYGIKWWDDWDCGDRTIGECYGKTVSNYDIMRNCLEGIAKDPYGRRHITNLWQYEDFNKPHGLKPCCYQCQYLVHDEYIDMIMYQRSSDWLTAGNVNQIQYVAQLMMVAKHLGYKPGMFYHVIANQQIYDRHMDQADIMVSRYLDIEHAEEQNIFKPVPKLIFEPKEETDYWSYSVDDFRVEDYEPIEPQLKFEVAV